MKASKRDFTLWYSITVNGRKVELWKRNYNGDCWHLLDMQIRLDGRTVQELPRRSITAEGFNAWEKLAGLRFYGYPQLPHCKSGGTPHWQHKRSGVIYYAPFTGMFDPSIFQAAGKYPVPSWIKQTKAA